MSAGRVHNTDAAPSDDLRRDPTDRLAPALLGALAPWVERPGAVCILFSGGVDSGLLAWELRSRPETTLFTVGLAGAPDLTAAQQAAPSIGLPWVGRQLTPDDLSRGENRVRPLLEGLPRLRRSIFLSLALAIDLAPPGAILCGQGADELFLGYAHFRGLSAEDAERLASRDLSQLQHEDWPRTERLAAAFGRTIAAPYLDPEFVRAALAIPTSARLPIPVSKALWRAWAARRGLPEPAANRPKRAMQYGSRIDSWVV